MGSGRRSHEVSLAIGLLAVSASAIFIRFCQSPPAQISFARLLGAGLVFLLWELARHRRIEISRRDFGLALLGAIFLGAHFYFWISSLFMTSINSSVMLLSTQALFALLIQQVVLRVATQRRNLISLLLGLSGVWWIARSDLMISATAGLGDFYSVVSAAMAACYLATGFFRRGRLLPYLGVLYFSGGLMLVIVAIARREPLLPVVSSDWFWYATLIIVPTLIGHTLINRAVEHFSTYVVNLSILTEPILTGILAWLVFGEKAGPAIWIGGPLILLSVAVEFLPKSERKSEE